jgi:hypothetical protein
MSGSIVIRFEASQLKTFGQLWDAWWAKTQPPALVRALPPYHGPDP